MAPILTTPSLPRRYCPLPPAAVPHPLPFLSLPYASSAPLSPSWTASPFYRWTSPPITLVQSHQRRQSPAPPSLSVAAPGADAFPSALNVTMPSHASILGASPLMDPRFAMPLLPSAPRVVSPYSCSTVAALSLPRTLDFVLKSGATNSVFRDAGVLRSFPRPLFIHGAGETMTLTCTGTSSLPCPASPSGVVISLYVPSCRHNLLSLSALQCLAS
ncbi:unnamed protein product [Closterium sp. NIES-65]|nr:unnamed protein product [Closterium sp. NIES-65]